MLTPGIASLRGKAGAHTMHSLHDSKQTTAKARATFMSRFEDEVDPERKLPEAERLRRVEHAKKAYYARLALISARKRSAKARG